MRSWPAIVLALALVMLPGCVAAFAQASDPAYTDSGQRLLMVLVTTVGTPAAAMITSAVLVVCRLLADAQPWDLRFRFQGREFTIVSRPATEP